MTNFHDMAKRFSLCTVLVILLALILALTLENKPFFLGVALGAGVSLLHLITTYRQVKKIGDAAVGKRIRFTPGSVFRIVTALITIYIAVQFYTYFDLHGVIIGLMITYIIIMFGPLFHRNKWMKEEGSKLSNND
ncbi:ATP synthase subunit I [Texcoconibacillus texcoconensis]|uniref:ATP synthase protein I n=1 Tax=Texcoconibacillus texcoconensis TaxID=1095777 RepID=A0A840QS22_9BACI|nr:ATP synthase subunit I [Texcoconibacillus texcoconensis]MBB5174077.1 ATP synthase protein I [Texcoconibacillus texcoconensis]